MRAEDFEAPGFCQICREDLASVYVVISRGGYTAKAHVCFGCFGRLEECGSQWVESVSIQEFEETVETDCSRDECGIQNAMLKGNKKEKQEAA
jgi:hypothetical protein